MEISLSFPPSTKTPEGVTTVLGAATEKVLSSEIQKLFPKTAIC
jgi:hypothetical protein